MKIRAIKKEDLGFITKTWIDHIGSLRYFKKTPRRVIRENMLPILTPLIQRSMGVVACSQEDENQIFGYLIYDFKCIHFAYTKLMYRNAGIFKELTHQLPPKIDEYSTQSEDRAFLDYAKNNKIIFNPWGQLENTQCETSRID